MNTIIKLQKQLKCLCDEKHDKDKVYRLFGFNECHTLDFSINRIINELLKEGLKLL